MSYLFEVTDLHAGYGGGHIVQGVSFTLERGEGLAIFGRNGVGKTTLMHALMGLVTPESGSILLSGKELAGRPTHQIARAGIAIVPQGRRLFPTLTVQENLTLGADPKRGHWNLERIFELLPRLAERRRQTVGLMSGGEQQMVAIGRALLRNPELLLLDEPSEGLAPKIIEDLSIVLRKLRGEGMSIVVVEQNLELGVGLADRVLIMDIGRIAYQSSVNEFRHKPAVAHQYLGVL
jgi:branched-chain amino acid transport system ATP-binding protein